MSWFTSLFAPSKSSAQGRRKVLSSTQEAFSLPSPVFAQNGPFTADSLATPDPDSAATPSYTYPPQLNGSQYSYVSTGTSSRAGPTSLLPLHNAPLSPSPPYPPLEQTWTRLRNWLSNEYPELGDTLNYGILPQDLTNIEMQFGFSLPQAVRDSYLVVDGQEPESSAGCSEGLFFGLHLLPLDEVLDEWRFWREVDDDPNTGAHPRLREVMQSVPPEWIRREYSQRGWIPLISDKTGNYVGVDLNPGEGGSVGQAIVFGRDFDTKVVLWRGDGPAGWARWLASFVEELESGEGIELGVTNEDEGSEDDVGYESYFFDGTGRGSGEGNGGAAAGGMRLGGEYRGWTTLEAWADRSVRKWREAGLVPDPPAEEDKGKAPEKVGLGVLNLTNGTASGAEVPIPVFADVSNTTPTQANGQDHLSKGPLPVISITKPPAPRPVDLPTHDDIAPAGLDSESFPDDIESRGALMQETSHLPFELPNTRQVESTSIASKPSQRATNSISGSAVPSSSTARAPAAPTAGVANLLDDAAPALAASPLKPSPSPGSSPQSASPPSLVPMEATPSSPSANGHESDAEDVGLTTTIRLVDNDSEAESAPDSGDSFVQVEVSPSKPASSTGPSIPSSGKASAGAGRKKGAQQKKQPAD
ncbi:hypothetical protein BC834DRAFT_855213 [Gloeopeniophorella convolvens]|nr:hypothetical protein BC834DRAFT_855213 [Gloeopeniophorella convolvens]